MQRLSAPSMMLMILAIPFAAILAPLTAYAKPTLLAREEITVKEGEDAKDRMSELVRKAVEKMDKHPCAEKARNENKQLRVGAKFNIVVGNGQPAIVVELWSDDCD